MNKVTVSVVAPKRKFANPKFNKKGKLVSFEINRKKWGRGDENHPNTGALYNSVDGLMCCLGHAARLWCPDQRYEG